MPVNKRKTDRHGEDAGPDSDRPPARIRPSCVASRRLVLGIFGGFKRMKRLGWILVLLMAASPAWATKKVNIQQLKDLLVSLQQAKKTDGEVAAELEQLQLTEQLTRATMNALNNFIPGPFSTEQFFVLEAASATLAPPAADLPTTPAP